MGFYPVEVLVNDAKRHGVAVLPVDVNREPLPHDDRVGRPARRAAAPRAPASTGGRRSSARRRCVVPERRRPATAGARRARTRLRHPARAAPRQGHRRGGGRGARRRACARRPVPLAGRPRGPDRAVRGGHRAAHPRRARSTRWASRGARLLWQLREVAGAARGRGMAGGRIARRRAGRSTCACRRPPAPDLPPPTELERLGDAYAILSLDARRQVIELFRPALDPLGALTARGARRATAGPGPHRRARRHPPAPDDRARHGLPGARGRDRHGQRHALATDLGAVPQRRAAPRAAATSRASSSARRDVVNVVARSRPAAGRGLPRRGRPGSARGRAAHGPRRHAPARIEGPTVTPPLAGTSQAGHRGLLDRARRASRACRASKACRPAGRAGRAGRSPRADKSGA